MPLRQEGEEEMRTDDGRQRTDGGGGRIDYLFLMIDYLIRIGGFCLTLGGMGGNFGLDDINVRCLSEKCTGNLL